MKTDWSNYSINYNGVTYDLHYRDNINLIACESYIPNSPSPEYPSDIKSVGTYNADTMKYEFDLISRGKNLWDWKKSKVVDIYAVEQATYGTILDGVYTNNRSFYSSGVHITVSDGTIVAGNTYTISFDVLAPTSQPIYFGVRNTAGIRTNTVKAVTEGVLSRVSMTVTAPVGYQYYQYVQLQGGSAINLLNLNVVFSNIQLELGSTTTPYEPFRGYNQTTISLDEPLNKSGDVEDTFNPITGEFVQRIGIKVFDGSETPVFISSRTNTTLFRFSITGATGGSFIGGHSLNTHFVVSGSVYSKDLVGQDGSGSSGTIYISVPNYIATDIETFKAWLAAEYAAGTPVTVLYQLATPTTTYLTPTQVPTFYPSTIISTANTEIKPTLTATLKTFQ